MIRRFRGALVALVVLVVVGSAWWASGRGGSDLPDRARPDEIFRFEKEDLVGFVVIRPGADRLAVRQVGGEWTVDGETWRPSRSMIRRVAHQLHDLDARADVVDAADDPSRYGLGSGAIQVELTLADGRSLAFTVGDPNPTGVSWYLGVGDRVYVVKKSAMDFWRLDAEAFREDRITTFDADEAVRLQAVVDGRRIEVERIGHRKYRMLAPVEQPASRDEVRMMLGRVSALRATSFVADAPADLAPWQLDPPLHTIAVELDTGARVEIAVGGEVPGADPPQRYVYLGQDAAVYAVKDGFLDAFRKDPDGYRDRDPIDQHEWDAVEMTVTSGDEVITLSRTSDGWRWPGGQAVSGSTPKRVAERAAELRVIDFDPPEPWELDPPWSAVRLVFADGAWAEVALGRGFEVERPPVPPPPTRPGEPPPPPAPRTEERRVARVRTDRGPPPGGTDPAIEIDGALAESIEDLVREYGRKRDRDAEKRLDAIGAPE